MADRRVVAGGRGRREGGVGGSLPRLPNDVDGMYSISYRSGHAYLDVAVLMRCRCDSFDPTPRPSAPLPAPALGGGGGGAGVGPHMFIYADQDRALYVNSQLLVTIGEKNVVLLEEGLSVDRPTVAGTDAVVADLGPFELQSAMNFAKHISLVSALSERLMRSQVVRAFVSP